jgi:thioredoxin 1
VFVTIADIVNVTEEENELAKLIKFEQPSCVPCKMVANFLHENNVEHTVYNVLEDFEETERFFVMGTPVTILLDDEGNELQRSVGFKPNELEEMISQL